METQTLVRIRRWVGWVALCAAGVYLALFLAAGSSASELALKTWTVAALSWIVLCGIVAANRWADKP